MKKLHSLLLCVLLLSTYAQANDNVPVSETKQEEEAEQESASFVIHVTLLLLACVLCVHFILTSKYLKNVPESIGVVFLGIIVGGVFKLISWNQEEVLSLDPEFFFLFMLPPIIFESGYNLNKGNFFGNLGSILLFAIVGTAISTFFLGFCLYLVGSIGAAFELPLIDCLVFGALISAVDPVAILAIFHSLGVHPTLDALVFGESVLNDAVAVVLYHTLINFMDAEDVGAGLVLDGVFQFLITCLGSVSVGCLCGLIAALCFKYISLRNSPSLELSLLCIFAYLPYGISEMTGLSGIMAILFGGITMSHYTHFNLSTVTKNTAQQLFRTLAFVCETSVFLYLGFALFTLSHHFEFTFILWALIFCVIGRALNIFPLSYWLNKHRAIQIPRKFQIIMCFSGLRGAIAFALSLSVPGYHDLLITTTLTIVLFTVIFFGGGAKPMLHWLGIETGGHEITISHTAQMGTLVEEPNEGELVDTRNKFEKLDDMYFKTFFRVNRRVLRSFEEVMTDISSPTVEEEGPDSPEEQPPSHSREDLHTTAAGLRTSFPDQVTPALEVSDRQSLLSADELDHIGLADEEDGDLAMHSLH